MEVINITEDAEVFTCNAYLVLGERTVLVDAGAMDGVVAAIREHTDSLDAVVLTHQHGDHVSELATVLDAFDCPCFAYGDHDLRTDHLDDGDTVEIGDEEFEAIYSPGHAADHIALTSDATIFSGDVVVHNDAAFDYGSFGRTDMPGQSRERLIESIKEILARLPEGVEHMYSGHGDEFHGDVRDVIETALGRAEQRKSKYPE
ncbi:MBL fold metallo-hydrolase [Haladaptatus sp. DYSN1]|uniref:MBL fold metallo-hydrolase n=1 Tax=unclassified Haladaptatus TaxID=2622732 RepID=UPI00240512F9|nr:MBL fold metallo-hydrolase [Haladaptatus sp. DYSN1]